MSRQEAAPEGKLLNLPVPPIHHLLASTYLEGLERTRGVGLLQVLRTALGASGLEER